MKKIEAARRIERIARALTAKRLLAALGKVSLEDVANVVRKGTSLTSCIKDIEALVGRRNVSTVETFYAMGIKIDRSVTQKGKPILVMSKAGVTPDADDIVVRNLVVGYM